MSKIEQSFKNFSVLPSELRMMVNDEMLPDDRCRFSGASKQCNIEATSSKNYIEFIHFTYYSTDKIQIRDRCGKNTSQCITYFYLEFKKEGESQYMAYKRLDQALVARFEPRSLEKELWREELSNSRTLIEHAVAYFKKHLQLYQKIIKTLILTSKIPGDEIHFDSEVTNLKNLEELKIDGNFNGIQFLSKTTRPLKHLCIWRRGDVAFPMDKVIRVQGCLVLPYLKLNNEQFLQLSAKLVHTNIGELTAEDVYNFIRSWQNGEVGKKLRKIRWDMQDSSFDTQNLFRLLGDYTYPNEGSDHHQISIKHSKETGKGVDLIRHGSTLIFQITYQYQ